jgi:hypothetical protein
MGWVFFIWSSRDPFYITVLSSFGPLLNSVSLRYGKSLEKSMRDGMCQAHESLLIINCIGRSFTTWLCLTARKSGKDYLAVFIRGRENFCEMLEICCTNEGESDDGRTRTLVRFVYRKPGVRKTRIFGF